MFTKLVAIYVRCRACWRARPGRPPYPHPRGSFALSLPRREYPPRSPSACAARMQVADRPDDRRVVRFLARPVRQYPRGGACRTRTRRRATRVRPIRSGRARLSRPAACRLNQGGSPLNDGPSCPAFAVSLTNAGFRNKPSQKTNPAIDAGADVPAV
jgi:hypothetical protein